MLQRWLLLCGTIVWRRYTQRTGERLSSDAFSKFSRVDGERALAHNAVVHKATMELLVSQTAAAVRHLLRELPRLQLSIRGNDDVYVPPAAFLKVTNESSTTAGAATDAKVEAEAAEGGPLTDAEAIALARSAPEVWLDDAAVSRVLHQFGLNCRHLGVLAGILHAQDAGARAAQSTKRRNLKLPDPDAVPGDPPAAALCRGLLRCMAIRTLKRMLRRTQRDCCRATRSAHQATVRHATAELLNLVSCDTAVARHFWRVRVVPEVLRAYGMGLPTHTQVRACLCHVGTYRAARGVRVWCSCP